MWGAISFGTTHFSAVSAASLELYIRANSPLDSINIGIELGDEILPQLSLSYYLPASYNCSLPSTWATAPVPVPMKDLLAGSVVPSNQPVRVNLKNSYKDGATVYVDNVRLIQ